MNEEYAKQNLTAKERIDKLISSLIADAYEISELEDKIKRQRICIIILLIIIFISLI